MSKKLNNNVVKLACIIILGFLLVIISNNINLLKAEGRKVESIDGLKNVSIETGETCIEKIEENDNNLRVYYFDVGQADSILVVNNQKTMLIDAGNNDDGELIVNNLKKLGISRIDYLIGTHPHEDHIGGLDNIIDNFDIGTIYMPKTLNNTKTFEDVLDSVAKKQLSITTPNVGDTFTIGDASCQIMSVEDNSENYNACSIVIRMVQNDISYLFMGDAETDNEQARSWPQTTILKVGHHGSSTSSCEDFLKQVMPTVSIISVGTDNKYGHPHEETITRLNNIGSTIYQTNNVGNILVKQEK